MLPHPSRRKRLETSQRAECERPCNQKRGVGSMKVERNQGQKIRAGELYPVVHNQRAEDSLKEHSLLASNQSWDS